MSDIIERAETLLAEVFDPEPVRYIGARGLIRRFITELEAARAENERLREELSIAEKQYAEKP